MVFLKNSLVSAGTLLALASVSHGSTSISSAEGVLKRTIGSSSRSFVLSDIPSENGLDTYEVRAANGKVYVAGSSAVAIARGAYEYIRSACHRQVTWGRMHVDLPKVLPDYGVHRVVCPNKFRHYFNVCTFGYSTVWWDWQRWQEEIDWMALHGINMPLAMNGQEAVWQKVWKQNGLNDSQIRSFFSGPAFLPWHRMGNVNGHGGPLAQSWIDAQAVLQKQIMERELSLGMTPISPAFSGFVPPAFRKVHPEAQISESTAWAGFEPTLLLNPRDPLYLKLGREFLLEYQRQFGTSHYYLADVYNEMTPKLSPETKFTDLERTGDAVYKAILAGDPKGTWVMQGWLFFNDRSFWHEKETEAFLKAVPDDRMVIIDLSCDSMEVWRAQPAVRKKLWIYCTLHNFGETTTLFGDLKEFANRPIRALNDASHGHMIGMGTTPEGIEQNPVVYELVTDTMWSRQVLVPKLWVKNYALARYGTCPSEVEEAWSIILRKVYDGSYPSEESRFVNRPGLQFGGQPSYNIADIRHAIQLLIQAAPKIGPNHLFDQDIVDLSKRYLEEVGAAIWYKALQSNDTDHRSDFTIQAALYLGLLDDLDKLLGTIPEYRLSTWVKSARRWGKNIVEQNQLEENARLQVTVWGGPILHDYAWKEWSGLVSSFYKSRWNRFFTMLLANQGKDFKAAKWDSAIADWELSWTKERLLPNDVTKINSALLASQLLTKYPIPIFEAEDQGIAVGRKVTVSGGTEGGFSPSSAVDGKSQGRYWSASPYPQWLQIDLDSVQDISRVQVITYHDGERYYQYNIECSVDGKNWETTVNYSKNKLLATARGTLHSFAPVKARYVRVNMLYNSANIGVHLYEVRVFKAP